MILTLFLLIIYAYMVILTLLVYLFNPNTKYRDIYRIPQISQKIQTSESLLIWPSPSDPYLELGLCIYPSKVHTHSSNHTHREHTPRAVGSHLYCGARGAVGGSVPCSRALCRVIEGGESAVHSLPHLQFLLARDSKPQPLDYESDSLTISPQLKQL